MRAFLVCLEPAFRELSELESGQWVCAGGKRCELFLSADCEEDSTGGGWSLDENWRPPLKQGLPALLFECEVLVPCNIVSLSLPCWL